MEREADTLVQKVEVGGGDLVLRENELRNTVEKYSLQIQKRNTVEKYIRKIHLCKKWRWEEAIPHYGNMN